MAIQGYQIAAGWNDAASLTNIENLTPSGATAYRIRGTDVHYYVRALGGYDVPYAVTPKRRVQSGLAVVIWRMSIVSAIALSSFRDTYGQDSSDNGKVTVRTRTADDGTGDYANYNAWCFVPHPQSEDLLQYSSSVFFENVTIEFRIVGTAS